MERIKVIEQSVNKVSFILLPMLLLEFRLIYVLMV